VYVSSIKLLRLFSEGLKAFIVTIEHRIFYTSFKYISERLQG